MKVPYILLKVKVKVLVYGLEYNSVPLHMTLQASHYLLVREICETLNEDFSSAAHLAHL